MTGSHSTLAMAASACHSHEWNPVALRGHRLGTCRGRHTSHTASALSTTSASTSGSVPFLAIRTPNVLRRPCAHSAPVPSASSPTWPRQAKWPRRPPASRPKLSGLDVVFANAGVALPKNISEVDEAHINTQIDINFKGVLFTVQKTLPLLRKPASIIFTHTAMAERGVVGMSVYAATKAAVRSLARTLAAELVDQDIRVNVVGVGLTETPIYGKLGLLAAAVQEWAGHLLKQVPAKRLAQPSEIANAVLFLATAESSYVTGANLNVDGGMATV